MAGESNPSLSTAEPLAPPFDWIALARGLAGAIVGGVVGYYAFRWLGKNGMLAPMLPGVLLGLGAGWAARRRIVALGVICGIAALALGVFSEWMRSPFAKDESFAFFVANITKVTNAPLKLGGILLGAAAAFWFGQGR